VTDPADAGAHTSAGDDADADDEPATEKDGDD
jgi:hypothetical protein